LARARPFVGLLYDPSVSGPVGGLTSPPYDVISPADHRRFYRISRHNIVRLILARNEPGDEGSGARYLRAGALLRAWREEGVLRATPRPSVYPYEFRFHFGGDHRTVRGLILEVDVEPWGGSIVPHERTLPGPIEDRLGVLRAVQANLSPVYALLVRPDGPTALTAFLDQATSAEPRLELIDEEGTRHRLWVTEGLPDGVVAAIARHQLMIADGHHRYTVAVSHREQMRALHGPGPWDGIMMLVVDAAAEDPPVLPIHRLLLTGPPPARQGERVRDLAEILATLRDDDLTVGLLERAPSGELIHRVAALRGSPPTVCALHEQVLDRAEAAQLRFVAHAAAAEESVASEKAVAAYLLPATRVERVWDVIRSGDKLPQKSTYFWPKPRTGLVIRPFDP
jgi:uncharacterized protein (DUF1015 family)